ncbi:uncharacterized protein LOC112212932 [Bombus impatiens]|uniref:Uncharacterized protein LOC112212932 n=1 Tax=Bombus impatiens TaxID=132113 RepID=A0A6P6FBF6_BOMIM|nr:uncharacterized protein LOC112212932 [Bombus impatiens]
MSKRTTNVGGKVSFRLKRGKSVWGCSSREGGFRRVFLSVFGSRYRFCGVEKLTTLTWTFLCRGNAGVYRREGTRLRIRIKPCSSHRLTRQVLTTCVTRILTLYNGPHVIVVKLNVDEIELDEKMTLR